MIAPVTAPVQAWAAVTAAHAPVERALDRALVAHDLTAREWVALATLDAGPRPMGDLALALAVTRPATTRLVDRLQARRLVTRSQLDGDARTIIATVTPAGRALAEAASGTYADALDTARPQLAQLAEHLRDLLPHLTPERGAHA